MESRPSGLPFSRPQSQQTLRDPRFASVPASQYASQPNTPRTDTLHQHDPFLRRRNDLEDLHRNTALAQPPQQYALPSTSAYPSNHTTAISDIAQNNGQVRRGSQSAGALFGGARMDRFGSQSSEGVGTSSQFSLVLENYGFVVGFLYRAFPFVYVYCVVSMWPKLLQRATFPSITLHNTLVSTFLLPSFMEIISRSQAQQPWG